MLKTNIYLNDLYKNSNVPYLFNTEITEYDMKEAGFSLICEYKLLSENTILTLSKMKKEKRTIEIGKITGSNTEFKKKFLEAFKYARELFFKANDIEENQVISIKKDAIFLNRKCKIMKFGEFIDFRPKNTYTSYIQLGSRLEFYYNPNELEIKGMSDENYEKHEKYMISFLKSFFNKMETESPEEVLEFMTYFISRYKRKELDVGYYRRFDFESRFVEKETGDMFDGYWEEEKDKLDISYNYFNILTKLVTIPLNLK